jgi:hypothetical protein
MKKQNKNPAGAKSSTARGVKSWSRLRRGLALIYGLILVGAISGIGFFVWGGSPLPVVPPATGAVVAGLASPFAPVSLKNAPAPISAEPDRTEASGRNSHMRVVIVIDDMGPDMAEARQAISLPPSVTLSFLPYARHVRSLASLAHSSGHEILLHLPMEPMSRKLYPGPHALLTELPAEELTRRLDWNLSQFDGYVGVNNHMGSNFTTNAADMLPMMQELKSRGLLFMDSRTSQATVGRRVAAKVGIPYAERDIFLDNEVDWSAVEIQLDKVTAIARKYGLAIAIGHPHPVTLEKLAAWIPTLEKQGITLVPLSQVVTRPLTVVKAESGALQGNY